MYEMDRITELPSVEVNQLKVFDSLNREDQIAFVRKSVLNLNPPNYHEFRPFMAELSDHILDSPNRKILLEESFNCVYENKNQFHYSGSDGNGYHSIGLSNIDDWVDYITLRDPYGSIVAAVSGNDFDITLEKVGMIVDKNSLPWVTENLIRTMVDKEDDPIVRDKLVKVGKVLIGLKPDDPRDFRLSLNELYKNISFENYPSNIDSIKKDLEVIEEVVKTTDSALADIGCGTGRIANAVAEKNH